MRNRLGLHIRVKHSIIEVLEKAIQLELPLFQCFFVFQQTGRLLSISAQERDRFMQMRKQYYGDLICHGSFWINLSSPEYDLHRALERECALAKSLAFTHLVLHAGTAHNTHTRSEGIDHLARSLNKLLAQEQELIIVLENSCHGNVTIGSDLLDFKQLFEKVDKPERINLCIDTAHAYAFGYDIGTPGGIDDFVTFLDTALGIERIKLIHLNDTKEQQGSMMDHHAVPGEGKIGKESLQRLIHHPQLCTVPLIIELPNRAQEYELSILEAVRKW